MVEAKILPIMGGSALMKALSIKKVILPPLVMAGTKLKVPIGVNNGRPIPRNILIKVIDTHTPPGGTAGQPTVIGQATLTANPGDNDCPVEVTFPDKIGMDRLRVELYCLVLMIIPRLHDVMELSVEKMPRPTVAQPGG